MKNPTGERPACVALARMWNEAVAAFLNDGPVVPEALAEWAISYRGAGRGAVEPNAFPEPFLGTLTGAPAGVFLALNPGEADLAFQGRKGIFAREIRRVGSYSAWAASWPYLRTDRPADSPSRKTLPDDPWMSLKKRNRHHFARLSFMRTWADEPELYSDDIVAFELYPWHSTAVTAAMRPRAAIVRKYLWEPIAELGAPVFAFGKPWFRILSDLGLEAVDQLGYGGRLYGSSVPSRCVTLFRGEGGLRVIAESHSGSAGPPRREEVLLLRAELMKGM